MDYFTKIYVRVVSPTTPSAQLTTILGLAPDESWDTGSPTVIGGKVKHHRFNYWGLVERIGVDDDEAAAVDRLIYRVRPIQDRFSELPPGSVIQLLVTLTTPHDVFGFGLTAEQLRFWSSIGADLEMSFAVAEPNPEPAGSRRDDKGDA